MVQNLGVTGQVSDENEGDEEKALPKYLIDFDAGAMAGRSLPMLIASRRCYLCQQADEDAPSGADPKQFIDRIKEHCAAERDYLLPDTPLKEAIFRVILASGNEPMTGRQVSEALTARWTMSAYPRDLSTRVIGRLLEHSENYHIVAVSEPEPEPEPELPTLDVAGPPEAAADSVEDESEATTPIVEATDNTSGDAREDTEPEGDAAEPPAEQS